jgi:hypothetical protein
MFKPAQKLPQQPAGPSPAPKLPNRVRRGMRLEHFSCRRDAPGCVVAAMKSSRFHAACFSASLKRKSLFAKTVEARHAAPRPSRNTLPSGIRLWFVIPVFRRIPYQRQAHAGLE